MKLKYIHCTHFKEYLIVKNYSALYLTKITSEFHWKFSKLNNFNAWHCSVKNFVQQLKKKIFLWLTQHRWSFSFVSRGRCFLWVFELLEMRWRTESQTHTNINTLSSSQICRAWGNGAMRVGILWRLPCPWSKTETTAVSLQRLRIILSLGKHPLEQKAFMTTIRAATSYFVIITVRVNRILMQESRIMI